LQNARADQDHQNLIYGHPCAFIHSVQAVQKGDDLLLIEKWNGGEDRATKSVIDQRAQFFFWVQGRRWAEERMFLALVYRFSDYVANRLAENVLLSHAMNFLVHGLRAENFDDFMVQKRYAALHRVRHFHAVAEHIKYVTGQQGL